MVRQPNATMMLTATNGVIATANRLKLCVTPCTSPRSDLANHNCIARVAMGNAPASLNPRTKRIAIRVTTPVVNPVKTTVSDQKGIIARSTLLGPKRSPSHPPGICPIAYAHKNALKTNPVAVLLSPNSFAMAGAATEMLLRSMYVSKYIRLIRNRTTHRVFVGLTAALSEMALDSRRGGMLVSNIVSVAAGLQSKSSTQRAQRTTENHREIGLLFAAVYPAHSPLNSQCSLWLFSVFSVLISEKLKKLPGRVRPWRDRSRRIANPKKHRQAGCRPAALPPRTDQPPGTPA